MGVWYTGRTHRMKYRTLFTIGALVILVGAIYITFSKEERSISDYRNTAYTISGQRIQLKDGVAETELMPGSASKLTTRYFGNNAKGDLNKDGIPDLAFIVTQEGGGSGTFFYIVASVQNPDGGYTGSDAVLLGDRIAPQVTEIHDGQIVVNYADRAPGESLVVQPSVGKSLRLKLDPKTMQLGEIAEDFEGEADPATMNLTMKTWNWVRSNYEDSREVMPDQPGKFTISFKGRDFKVTTDCNEGSGTFLAKNGLMALTHISMTKMYCSGSQEDGFMKDLENVRGYHFTSRGELILQIKFDSGSMTFR